VPALDKIIGIAMLGRSVAEGALRQRVVPNLVTLGILAIATAVIASLLALALCYAGYMGLLYYGLTPEAAFYSITACLILALVACLYFMKRYIRKLHQSMYPLSPLTDGVSDIVDAFTDGFRRTPAKISKQKKI